VGEAIKQLLGERIRRRRRMLGLSQAQLARAIGVRADQIQKYETGAHQIYAERLYKLASALGVTPNQLFELNSSEDAVADEMLTRPETQALVQAIAPLPRKARSALMQLALDLASDLEPADVERRGQKGA
jgi:transcriptional regulator with XRE-family HTH domain